MTRASLAIVILSCSVFAKLEPRSHNTHEFFALQLDGFTHPDHIATALGAQYAGPIGGLPDHHAFSLPKRGDNGIDALLRAQRNKEPQLESSADALDSILWSTTIPAAEHSFYKREPPMENAFESILTGQPDVDAVHAQNNIARSLGIDDPLFPQQWHLFNTVQVGNDLNVTGVWLEGIAGENVTTAIVDDGLDMDSLDLRPNYYASGSYDFNDLVPEPKPRLEDDHHGTRCAGEVAAAKNDVCGIGVAYNSRVSGIRMLSGKVDDIDQAAAINYDYQHNDIYSCSWGPPDDGMHMKAPGLLVQRAIVNGVQNGRGGKGSIFVFSAGNGASQDDNCNFDGYTNSIYSVTVGAIDRMGKHPLYSESCSALLVSAFSSGSGEGIYTTDNGPNECSSLHSGTSAAGPLAAGVIALALSARPDLTWRDIQYLLVETSVPVHELDGSWQPTKSGRIFSHDWGYGKVDAYSLVQKAKTWDLVKPQAWFHSPWLEAQYDIPEGHEGVSSSYEVTPETLRAANIARLEHVTVTINVDHTSRGDISVALLSPGGVVSYLSTPRIPDRKRAGYVNWEFMSVAHWGESGTGKWKIIVKDTNVNGFTGRFVNWRLNLWGEAVDGSHQPLHPLPDGYGGGVTEVATITAPIPISTPTETDKANSPEGLVNVNSFTTGETVPIPATSSRDTALRHNFSTYSVHAHAFIITATLSMIIFCSAIGFCLCASRLRVHERSLYEQLEMRNTGRYPGQLRRHDIDSYRSSSETDNEQIPRQ